MKKAFSSHRLGSRICQPVQNQQMLPTMATILLAGVMSKAVSTTPAAVVTEPTHLMTSLAFVDGTVGSVFKNFHASVAGWLVVSYIMPLLCSQYSRLVIMCW